MMTAGSVFLIAVMALLVLILLEVPIAFALFASAVLGLSLASGIPTAVDTSGTLPFNRTASYSLAVIPMYMIMGSFAARAGLARDLFDIANRHLRKVPGGLAIAGISGCAGFAAITGSSVATAASVGRIAIEEMRRHSYSLRFASGAIAAAGTLGILIPPSIALVLFGIVTNTSIADLLIAGIIPGILSAVSYSVMAVGLAKLNPALVGKSDTARAPKDATLVERSLVDRAQYWSLVKVGVLFVIVVGGVYGGLFTATEAGGIGAVAALVILLLSKASGERKHLLLGSALGDAAGTTSRVFFIVLGGAVFTYFMVSIGIPAAFAEWAVQLPVPNFVVLLVVLLSMVPLGMVLDSLSITLVYVPVVFPIIDAMGFNAVWFGILCIKLIELGMVTPPVGMNAFVIAGSVRGVKSEDVFRGVVPFILADVVVIAILLAVPEVTLFLPSLRGG